MWEDTNTSTEVPRNVSGIDSGGCYQIQKNVQCRSSQKFQTINLILARNRFIADKSLAHRSIKRIFQLAEGSHPLKSLFHLQLPSRVKQTLLVATVGGWRKFQGAPWKLQQVARHRASPLINPYFYICSNHVRLTTFAVWATVNPSDSSPEQKKLCLRRNVMQRFDRKSSHQSRLCRL